MHAYWTSPLSPLEHFGFVAAGLLVYVLVTRIRQQRRHPSAAIAWVAFIALIPYVGVPLFLAVGTRKFVRPSAAAPLAERASAEGGAPPWAAGLLAGLGIAAAAPCRFVRFQDDGAQALDALVELVERAKRDLEVCTFLIGDDAVGARVAEALAAAVRRGVRVRFLIDAFGSIGGPRRLLGRMQANGIEVRRFMPLLHNSIRGRTNLRNHRKLAIADGELLWSGGRNLALEYFFDHGGRPAWHDLSVVVEGTVALQARRQFERDWTLAGGNALAWAPSTAPQAVAGPPAQWIASGPDFADDTVYALLMAGAYHARSRILAVTPYFVPDDALLDAWCLASRRGVQVTLVVPRRSNHRIADWARARALRRLVQDGASVVLAPSMVHAKAVVIDGDVALCGSLNLDSRSLFLNFEAMTALYGASEIAWLAAWIGRQAQGAAAYPADPPPWWRDVGEGIARSIGFQL